MNSINAAILYLNDLERFDLCALLQNATYCTEHEGEQTFYIKFYLHINCFPACAEALNSLPDYEKNKILEAISTGDQQLKELVIPTSNIVFDGDANIKVDNKTELFVELFVQKQILIEVATGKKRIQDVDDQYKVNRKRLIKKLGEASIDNPNPFESLWDWYHKWKAEFGTYAERRQFISGLYAPIFEKLFLKPLKNELIIEARPETGWERVDRTLSKAKDRIRFAKNEEDFQTIGLLCREILISLSQAVFNANVHKTLDGTIPSATDAKRMIDAYIAFALAGHSNECIRKHAKASLDLALDLQHRRTANQKFAALCLEATFSTVNIISIISERFLNQEFEIT